MWIDDQIIARCSEALVVRCWIPERPMVVLGSSNKLTIEVNHEACRTDQIPILRRYGGGGAVVLFEGCLVVSAALWVKDWFQNGRYFSQLNFCLAQALNNTLSTSIDFKHCGISDIAVADRKIAGTSMFRSRNYLLYQASVIAKSQFDLMERYLAHPSREPDYRAKRKHRDFLTSLEGEAKKSDIDLSHLAQNIESHLPGIILEEMKADLNYPMPEQFRTLLSRLSP